MPPKATRIFTVDEATGEVRCGDPSCAITQCGQCNKEQGRRKRAAKSAAAAKKQKEQDDRVACEKARKELEGGKVHVWTYDNQGGHDEGDQALQSLQESDDTGIAPARSGENSEDNERFKNIMLNADKTIATLQRIVNKAESQAEPEGDVFVAEKSRGKTTWNHTTRVLLYKCIQKYNPFAAPVKKDEWNVVAIEMAKATALMHDPKTGDFRVKSDGHGLEVFYARRVEDMKRLTSKESSLSGQAGAEVTAEQTVEFSELQACMAKEADAALIRDNKRRAKSALEDIKNHKVTQLVKDAAAEDPVVKARTFKLLQTKVRAAKLEASVWEKQYGGLGKFSYNAQQLADIEYLAVLKKDFPAEDSDVLPESDGAEKKRGGVAAALGELIAKLPTAVPANHVDASEFAHAFFQAKQSYQAREGAARKRTLGERLADVEAQHKAKHISEAEKLLYEAEIKKQYFMQE